MEGERSEKENLFLENQSVLFSFLFLGCQRRAVGVIKRRSADLRRDSDELGCFLLPVKETAAGEAAGLPREDKGQGRKHGTEKTP